jgi:hypothetical protein
MKALRTMWMVGLTLWLGTAGGVARSEESNSWPPFRAILESIEANLPGLDQDELNAVMVQALLDHYAPRVMLVPTEGSEVEPRLSGAVGEGAVFDRSFGYLQVRSVGPGLDEQLREAWAELASGDRLQGLVLDLRFAGGYDYEAAARAADWLVTTRQPLLAWQETIVHATPDEETVMPPVVVLVNEGSSGAAEALAAVLREGGVAVLVGSRTAGQAYVFREVPLPEGRTLRVASDPVLVGDGKSIAGGLVPDIEVTISLADERKYLADPYAVLPGAVAGTALRAERSEVNEAELMRQRQSGTGPRLSPGAGATPPARLQDPVVQDPALARALDLLKGIAVVGRGR